MAEAPKTRQRIKVTKNGPYVVTGRIPVAREKVIIGSDGEPERWEKGEAFPDRDTCALCRCGHSKNKPYCDGSHTAAGFDGTETASRRPYLESVEKTTGPALDLTYSDEFCAEARFCHRGEEAWGYAGRSGDPEARKEAIREACDCPSGSLVAWDKATGEAIEPDFPPSIIVIENPQDDADSPLGVKGGVPIESADGFSYEKRNRVTLCTCGRSKNKPFCDARHRKSP